MRSLFKSIFVFVFFLAIAEMALRLAGYKPGKISYSPWNNEVEHLSAHYGFTADNSGIFKVDANAKHWIDSVIQQHKNDTDYKADRNIPDSLVYEVYSLGYESLNLIHAKTHNELSAFYQQNKNEKDIENDFRNAVKDYVEHPINSDGFRSIEFKQYKSAKKKILLLGDSFTWGHSASDITNSFADILLSKEYAVYNAGISGADPAQYAAIAEKYIPLLQPDVVIVNFYLGNDVQYFERKAKPLKPIFFATNGGNLIACPYTTYFSDAKAAYDFMAKNSHLSHTDVFKTVCSKTSITTLLWMTFRKFGWVWDCPAEYKEYFARELSREQKEPTANVLIKQIEILCAKNNSRFILAIIPERKTLRLSKVSEYKNLFTQQNYFYPSSLTIRDYRSDDGHFNDEGQKSYSDFLIELLEKNH